MILFLILLCLAPPRDHIIRWDMAETKAGGPFPEILKHDVFVNCIYLMQKIPPFLTKEMLDTEDRYEGFMLSLPEGGRAENSCAGDGLVNSTL